MWWPVSKSTKTIYILYVEFVFKQTACHAASRWQSWSETSLQSMVDVNFSEKWPRIRAQRIDLLAGQSAKSLSGEEVCPERGIDAGSEAFSA